MHPQHSNISHRLFCGREYSTVIAVIHFINQIFTFLLYVLYFLFTHEVWQYCIPITMKLHGTHIIKRLDTVIFSSQSILYGDLKCGKNRKYKVHNLLKSFFF